MQQVEFPGIGLCRVQRPRSLAFEAMDEGEFNEVMRAICRHIAANYWQSCTPDEIAKMAEAMVDE